MFPNPIKFSVIIPAYNYGNVIARAIDSVLIQHYPQVEIIVVDDGSTDNTKEILDSYRNHPVIKIIAQHNQGVSSARNNGAVIATGDYCLFLDADDALVENALNILSAGIQKNPNAPWIAGSAIIIQEDKSNKIRRLKKLDNNPVENFISYLKHEFSIPNGSVAISKKIVEQISFPENLRNCEDFVFCAQLLANTTGIVLQEPILMIYKHSQSLRNNFSNDLKTGTKLVSVLFRSERLPKNLRLKKYKRLCLSLRLLDMFRGLYLAQDHRRAKRYYIRAVKCYFPALFYFSYFRKFVRTFLEERAKRGSRKKFLKVLKNAPKVEPEDFDKI